MNDEENHTKASNNKWRDRVIFRPPLLPLHCRSKLCEVYIHIARIQCIVDAYRNDQRPYDIEYKE